MYLLTFDTSLNRTYITLSRDEKILVFQIIGSENGIYHSEFLISAVDKILKDNSLEMKDINAVATNIGPGSFTGIRTCNTVARVMGQQLGIDVVGVCSLEIISLLNKTQKKRFVLWMREKQSVCCCLLQGGTLSIHVRWKLIRFWNCFK
jgi:tRNA threonylcarbamoyl adenosine modification protein YeaZ